MIGKRPGYKSQRLQRRHAERAREIEQHVLLVFDVAAVDHLHLDELRLALDERRVNRRAHVARMVVGVVFFGGVVWFCFVCCFVLVVLCFVFFVVFFGFCFCWVLVLFLF